MAQTQVNAGSEERRQTEISLTPQIDSSLCRHGRRRFRDIQAATAAKVRFDRARSVLKVLGTPSEVESIRKQLECLGGVRKAIPAAAWCELMRTRLEEDPEKSVLQQMQAKCGCRIHIERTEQEVRIFGPYDGTMYGIQLVDEFVLRCREVSMPVARASVPSDVMEGILEACNVTLNRDEDQVLFYGLEEATAEAAKRIREYMLEADGLCLSADTDDDGGATASGDSSSSAGSWYDDYEAPCREVDSTFTWSEAADLGGFMTDMEDDVDEELPPTAVPALDAAALSPPNAPAVPCTLQQVPMPPVLGQGQVLLVQQACPVQVPCQWMFVAGPFPQTMGVSQQQPCQVVMQPCQAVYMPSANGMALPLPTPEVSSAQMMQKLGRQAYSSPGLSR